MTEQKGFEPMFLSEMEVPEIPNGVQVVRSHGEAAIIRARQEDEPLYGRTGLTLTEVADLTVLQQKAFKREQSKAAPSSIYED